MRNEFGPVLSLSRQCMLFCVWIISYLSCETQLHMISPHPHLLPPPLRFLPLSLIIETESNVDRIILSPPPLFVTPERESVVVPCVGSQDPVFSGAAAVGGNSSSFGLTITPTRENGGYDSIICTVGEASEQGYISVIGK